MVSAINKVDMSVVEARKQQPSVSVDNLGLRAMPCVHFGCTADGHNAVAQHGEGFCLGTSFVYGPDSGVGDDQVSSRFALGKRRGSQTKQAAAQEQNASRYFRRFAEFFHKFAFIRVHSRLNFISASSARISGKATFPPTSISYAARRRKSARPVSTTSL